SWQNSICQIYGWRPLMSTVFLLLFTGIFAQNVATQSFSVIGYDDENLEISISLADITVNNGEEIQSISISNFTAEYYFFGEGDDYFEGCEDGWYDFDFSVTGGVSDGEEMLMVCGSEFIGLDVTGFSNLTVTTYDADGWSDERELVLTLEVTYGEGGDPEPNDYCDPVLDCTDGDLISNVTFQEINNTTTCSPNGYGDYTDQIANVEAGQTYPISITVGDGWYEHAFVWIDFGNDGSFDEPEDFFGEIGLGGTGVTVEGEIEIPADVADGEYRMRVLAYAGPEPDGPCMNNSFDYGEYEDYTISVTASEDPEPGEGCEWTVTVEDSGYGDEVSWELRGADGSVLLSGGDYGLGYTDVQTVTASGPVEFYIEAMGTYGDNDPSYSVSNGTEELVSGELLGGDDATYSDLMCGEGGYDTELGEGGSTCEDAIAVATLPYDHAGNTADYGNDYDETDTAPVAPDAITTGTGSTSYLSGDEVVYAYTPSEDQVINISTTNDDNWIGLWAFTGCPFESTVGYHTAISGTTRLIQGLPVTAGETYYFVVSTWDPPLSTEYTIHIELAGEPEPGEGPCEDKTIMECGETYTADLEPSSGEWTNYTDVTYNYTGSEKVWEFTATTTGDYTFILDEGVDDADFFLMDACSNTATNLSDGYWTGLGDETITLTEGVTYYLIADLYSASGATTVSVSVTCPGDEPDPEPGDYCDLISPDCSVEKINSVTFAGIENLNTGCGTAETNDFTDMVANVERGGTYPMIIEIEADPGFPDDNVFFFIDWNQNGTLDDAGEVYEVIMHTGTSGEYTVDVTVPTDAVIGETRLRVGIAYNSGFDFEPIACPLEDEVLYGEYEDYTVNVGELGISNLNAFDFAYYPNPVKDVLNISAKKNVENVSVFNLAGQKVLSNAKVTNGQIDVNALTAGTYVFRITLEGGQVETFKIIKK